MKNYSKIYNISDKVVFVTGAGKGIGRALIDSLISKNVYVFALTKSKQDLKDIKNKSNIKIFYGDVSNEGLTCLSVAPCFIDPLREVGKRGLV